MFSKDEGRIVITAFVKHLMDRRLIPPLLESIENNKYTFTIFT